MTAPLFRVFFHQGADQLWAVCAVTLEGEPVGVHSEHADLDAALYEAARANYTFQEEE